MMVEPFKGLRVVELCATQAVAQVTQLLADFGAEVVMIEAPGGSPLRQETAFPFWARGKKSVVLDLENEADRGELAKLLHSADVLVEACPVGQLEAWGLGHESLIAANPRLVHGSITPFGPDSPYSGLPFHDDLVQARIGLFSSFFRMARNPKRPPFVSPPFSTHAATHAMNHGLFSALMEREHSGRGQHVDARNALAFYTIDSWQWSEHAIAKRFPDAMVIVPSYDDEGRPRNHLAMRLLVAPTADGHWLQFAATAPRLFRAKMKALGLDWMFDDPEWAEVPMFETAEKFMDLWVRMVEATRTKTMAEWLAIFDADPDVFAEEFRPYDTVLDHPQLVHDGFSVVLEDPENGPVRQPGPLIKADRTPAQLRPAPRLDADRGQVLGQGWSTPAVPCPEPTAPAPRGLPLEGVTIVELCSMYAAPGGPALLAELGARVIKVEPPEGDPIRHIAALPEVSGIRPMLGKESICIDLTKEAGRQLARDLCRDADVVVQSFRAGAVQRLGLDYEAIRQINPDVVYLNACGYGIDGPYGHRPAYAPSIGAAAGFAMINLGMGGEESSDLPFEQILDIARRLSSAGTTNMAQADGAACNGVATGIMFGLYARARGAGGQQLGTSMLNTGSHMMSGFTVTWPGAPAPLLVDEGHTGVRALRRTYAAKSGYVMVVAKTEAEWHGIAEALGAPELAADPRFATFAARDANDAALTAALGELFKARSAQEWEQTFVALRLGVIQVAEEQAESVALDTPFGEQHHLAAVVEDPTWGELPRLVPHVAFSRSTTRIEPAVLAGQQTDQVLTLAGMADRIEQLRADGVVS
ncbi:MAG TPA: CoA transferase [Novosphingobium sp.]|nr:CoA transferase [Novosphingobium sp.]